MSATHLQELQRVSGRIRAEIENLLAEVDYEGGYLSSLLELRSDVDYLHRLVMMLVREAVPDAKTQRVQ